MGTLRLGPLDQRTAQLCGMRTLTLVRRSLVSRISVASLVVMPSVGAASKQLRDVITWKKLIILQNSFRNQRQIVISVQNKTIIVQLNVQNGNEHFRLVWNEQVSLLADRCHHVDRDKIPPCPCRTRSVARGTFDHVGIVKFFSRSKPAVSTVQ
jgi:hypothetical protein